MRPFEAFLCLSQLLTLIALVAAPGAWPRGLALVAVLAAVAEALLEGPRWQMGPAYVFSLALALAAFWPGVAPPRVIAWAGAAGGALALAIAVALPLAFPVFRFPAPTGPYAIGTVTYHWTDAARAEAFTADPADRRELMVQVWYPAAPQPSAPRAPYVPDGAALAPLARLLGLPGFLLRHLQLVKTHAVAGAPVAPGRGRYPVLVFAHGRGGYRQHNTYQVEELVSHGYVVVAIDQPYAAAAVVFPDGRRVSIDPRMQDRRFEDRMIPELARDVSFALDRLAVADREDARLKGRLDLDRAGVFGLSLGGAVAAEACRIDPRLRACLAMDVFMPASVVRAGLRQPTMWISRDAATMRREGWREADVTETQETMRAVYETLPGDGYLVLLPGAFHVNFSDAPLMVAPALGRALRLAGPIDAARAHQVVDAVSLAFFDRYLKGEAAPLLDDPAKAYPEVVFESRR